MEQFTYLGTLGMGSSPMIYRHLDFGHTDPQVPMPYGGKVRIDPSEKRIFANF